MRSSPTITGDPRGLKRRQNGRSIVRSMTCTAGYQSLWGRNNNWKENICVSRLFILRRKLKKQTTEEADHQHPRNWEIFSRHKTQDRMRSGWWTSEIQLRVSVMIRWSGWHQLTHNSAAGVSCCQSHVPSNNNQDCELAEQRTGHNIIITSELWELWDWDKR